MSSRGHFLGILAMPVCAWAEDPGPTTMPWPASAHAPAAPAPPARQRRHWTRRFGSAGSHRRRVAARPGPLRDFHPPSARHRRSARPHSLRRAAPSTADQDLRDLAHTVAAIRGDDAPSRALLGGLVRRFGVRGMVVVGAARVPTPSPPASSWAAPTGSTRHRIAPTHSRGRSRGGRPFALSR